MAITNETIEALRDLNHSNQLDTDAASWSLLCNLLDDDIDGHDRRLARAGIRDDAELRARMADAISARIREMEALARARREG